MAVDFAVSKGKILALVGESGCGKSVTVLSAMGLVPCPPGRIVGGEIIFNGRNLVGMPPGELRKIRGNEISMIFKSRLPL